MPATKLHQIRALLWKDRRLARTNRCSLAFEIIIPLLLGIAAGVAYYINKQTVYPTTYNFNQLWAPFDTSWNGDWIGVSAPVGSVGERVGTTLFEVIQQQQSQQSYRYNNSNASGVTNTTTTAMTMYSSLLQLEEDAAVVEGVAFQYWYKPFPRRVFPIATSDDGSSGTSWTFYSFLSFTGTPQLLQMGQAMGLAIARSMTPPDAANSIPPLVGTGVYTRLNIANKPVVLALTSYFLLAAAYMFPCIILTGRLVEEKRVKMREMLKVMGLQNFSLVAASLLNTLLHMILLVVVVPFIIAAFGVLQWSGDLVVAIIAQFSFAVALGAFSLLVASIVSHALVSNVLVTLVFVFGMIGGSLSSAWGTGGAFGLSLLLPPTGYFYAITPLMAKPTVLTMPITAWGGIGMLWLQAFISIILALYIQAVAPGDFGVAKNPLWFCRPIPAAVSRPAKALAGSSADAPRIVVKKLTKQFKVNGEWKTAVDELDLTIAKGEIFALLGHNGAGKTTTIGVLTGMIEATGYSEATVNGWDALTQMDNIRGDLGYCPQFDVLYNDLSAVDHFMLFSMLKSHDATSHGYDEQAVEEMLQALELPTDPKQKVSTFSGGMKRRLSVGNAIIGQSSVLFLDEPSSGLDPLSRRKLWDVIKRQQAMGKTIVLTTHFMEEADYLGNRIGIMSHGRMYACATSYELKRDHGVGFTLTAAKRDRSLVQRGAAAPQVDCTASMICECLRRFIPSVEPLNDGTSEITVRLPADALPQFGPMLEDFEQRMSELGLTSYAVAMCTLEDVFLQISSKVEKATLSAATAVPCPPDSTDPQTNVPTQLPTGEYIADVFNRATNENNVTYWARLWNQTRLIFGMKFVLMRRRKRMWLMGGLIPLMFMALGFGIVYQISGFSNPYRWTTSAPSNATTTSSPVPSQPSLFNRNVQSSMWDTSNVVLTWLNFLSDAPRAGYDVSLRGEARLVKEEFQRLYSVSRPTYVLTVLEVNEQKLYQTGAYIPCTSLSFLTGAFGPEPDFGIHVQSINLLAPANGMPPATPVGMQATYMYGYIVSAPFLSEISALLQLAAANVALNQTRRIIGNTSYGGYPKVETVELRSVMFPYGAIVLPSTTTTTTTTTTTASFFTTATTATVSPSYYTPAPQKAAQYSTIGLTMMILLSVSAASIACVLPMADEVQRKVYTTMLAQGLLPLAYFAGNMLFDLFFSSFIIVIFFIGSFANPIPLYTTSAMVMLIIGLYQYIFVMALIGYVVVCYFPLWRVLAYCFVLYLLNIAMVALPYIIVYVWSTLDPISEMQIDAVIQTCMPSSAIFYMFQSVSNYDYLSDSTGDIVAFGYKPSSTRPPTGYVFFFLLIHAGPWLGLLWSFGTRGPVHKKWARMTAKWGAPKDPEAANTPGTAAAPADAPPPPQQVGNQNSEEQSLLNSGQPVTEDDTMEDVDVSAEGNFVRENVNQQMMMFDSVKLQYGHKFALRGVSFGIRPNECFGLLGPNGAGKTTSCRLLLHEMEPTDGSLQFPFCGVRTTAQMTTVAGLSGPVGHTTLFKVARLGVCQQHDTLWEHLNATEHIELFLRIRLGPLYDAASWKDYIAATVASVQLSVEGRGKDSSQYSGGMKRKLQVALAVYTGALTVFLDEPSTGMDPFARRALWRIILGALQGGAIDPQSRKLTTNADSKGPEGRCVVLTTHSMEEAEAVCGRIAILTHGKLRCIGSGQHLKDRFGSGYVLTFSFDIEQTPEQRQVFLTGVQTEFPGAVIVEDLVRVIRFAVGTLPSLSGAFRTMEAHRAAWGVSQYAVNQTASLEQVFLRFVNTAK